ncbi:hypothetical protein [Nostoc sp. WHI]|uniref:hypothetical protein n=1 Tax=Nostoc sp. WHI TaxID=2650611 RepID=UPI001E396FCA|nr:hypothetical protein [Nostoc sp. WHI]
MLVVIKKNPFQNPPPYEKLVGDLLDVSEKDLETLNPRTDLTPYPPSLRGKGELKPLPEAERGLERGHALICGDVY